jgi:peptidoglycan lytic transglycosylase
MKRIVVLLLLLTMMPEARAVSAQTSSDSGAPKSRKSKKAPAKRSPKRVSKSAAKAAAKPKPRLTPADASGLRDARPGTLKAMAIAVLEKDSATQAAALETYAKRHPSDVYGALAQLVLGWHAYQKKRFSEAKAHFDAVRHATTPVQDYGEYYLALSEIAADERAAAADLLDGFASRYPSSALGAQAVLRETEILLGLDRASLAIPLLLSPSVTLPQTTANLLLGEAYRKDGQGLRAAETLQKIYYFQPTSYQAAAAERYLRDLRIDLGESYPKPTEEMRAERADRLFAASQWQDAESEYRSLAATSSGAERDRMRVRVGVCQYHAGQNQAALAHLRETEVSDPDADAERSYTIAAIHRRLEQPDAMERELQVLAAKHPESEWYEKALFLAGNYYLVNHDPAKASEHYAALYQRFPNGAVAPESHWRVAWRRYRERNLSEARRLFVEQIQNYPSSPQVSAAIYWAGRTLEAESAAEAAIYYRKLATTLPNYYYGLAARQRLASLGKLAVSSEPVNQAQYGFLDLIQRPVLDSALDEKSLPASALSHRIKARLLESAWLIDLAIDELKAGVGADTASNFYLGRELAHLEEARSRYNVALNYAKRLLNGYFALELTELSHDDWELLFPLPWWVHIEQKARAMNLDPYLVAGLIRQESEFNPEARSHSNARGLMQLMPATAQRMARQMSPRRSFRLASLNTPEYNVAFGTFYLRQVLNQFNGSVEQALAAYNAGENRVVEWLAEGNFEEPAEFVESIPFTETREYVQAVMRNAALYRMLYRDEKEIEKPERIPQEATSVAPKAPCRDCNLIR